jgi:uncharacterized phage protein (TIGR01671 family)
MSRAIKYRVWDVKRKRLAYPAELFVSQTRCEFGDGGSPRIAPLDEVVLEQFTGLLDSKGQEIYEGDIVWYGTSHAVVQWKGVGFACSGLGHYCTDPERPLVSECTVIGNIRENPERLTQP